MPGCRHAPLARSGIWGSVSTNSRFERSVGDAGWLPRIRLAPTLQEPCQWRHHIEWGVRLESRAVQVFVSKASQVRSRGSNLKWEVCDFSEDAPMMKDRVKAADRTKVTQISWTQIALHTTTKLSICIIHKTLRCLTLESPLSFIQVLFTLLQSTPSVSHPSSYSLTVIDRPVFCLFVCYEGWVSSRR